MWPDVPRAVEGLDWQGRIVIDPTNDFDPSDLDGRTSSEVVADLVAPARVVKAANTLVAAVLGSDPHQAGGQRVIFLSGDDAEAKLRSRRCSRTPASSSLTSASCARAARCSRSVLRWPATT